jgi:putative transposase
MFGPVQFFTATILNWIPLLDTEERKRIITDSFQFMVTQDRAQVFAFVIMPNHFHVLWAVRNDYTLDAIQRDILKFTGQKLKFHLQDTNDTRLEMFRSTQADRAYQIWERRPKWKEVNSNEMVSQVIDYIHGNPLKGKWNLCDSVADYKFSSAAFYETGKTNWEFLKHVADVL